MATCLCINPDCTSPVNPVKAKKCAACHSKLFLHDRFRALRMLGKGAFGRTYLAYDQQSADKQQYPFVVLKMFFSQFTSDKALELFRGEAQQLKMLSHTCIPRYIADFEEEGRLFLVQEHIEGQTLTKLMQTKGCFTDDEVIVFLRNMTPILKYIHSQGVIHRDIKPDNIMLRRRDMCYVLVDFGASHWQQVQEKTMGPREPNPEATGTVIGTPGFISPEVLNGERTEKCDVYSLGVTAMYLLTGVNPTRIKGGVQNWKRAIDMSGANNEVVQMIDEMIEIDPFRRHLPVFSSLPTNMLQPRTSLKTALNPVSSSSSPSSSSSSSPSSSSSSASSATPSSSSSSSEKKSDPVAPVAGVDWERKEDDHGIKAFAQHLALNPSIANQRMLIFFLSLALLFFFPALSVFTADSVSVPRILALLLFLASASLAYLAYKGLGSEQRADIAEYLALTQFPETATTFANTVIRKKNPATPSPSSSSSQPAAQEQEKAREDEDATVIRRPVSRNLTSEVAHGHANPFAQTMAGASTHMAAKKDE